MKLHFDKKCNTSPLEEESTISGKFTFLGVQYFLLHRHKVNPTSCDLFCDHQTTKYHS